MFQIQEVSTYIELTNHKGSTYYLPRGLVEKLYANELEGIYPE